jgi:hypothetical protein
MAQVDFTLEDLKEVFATKDDLATFATKDDLQRFASKDDLLAFATKDDLREGIIEVLGEVRRVKGMLEGNARAESVRLDRVDKRSLKTQRLLIKHMADPLAHTWGTK